MLSFSMDSLCKMEWRRNCGVQCPLCLFESRHRAPTCDMHDQYITDDIKEDVEIICKDFNKKFIDQKDANDLLESLFFDITAYDLLNNVVVVINFSPDENEKIQFIEEYGQYWEGDYNAIPREYDSVTRKFHIYWTDDNEYAGEMTALELYQYADYGHDSTVLSYLEQFP